MEEYSKRILKVMNLHEYQAKEILRSYQIPIPDFKVASSGTEAKQIADLLGLEQAVIKIQVHAGGRGKAGGVKFAKNKHEIEKIANDLIGMKMINIQTGKEGVIAHKVLISRPVEIQKEYYSINSYSDLNRVENFIKE